MSENIQLFKQIDPKCAGCLKLTPMECADYLLWSWEHKTAKVDFAMRDVDPHYLCDWWGIKISAEFGFTIILCGHYWGVGGDFEAKSLNTLMDEHRYDEDVCECGTHHSRQVLTLGKYLTKLNEDHGGNPDYLFCEISDDMREWLTKVKKKEIIDVPIPETEKPPSN